LTATRQVFENLARWEIVLWYCLVGISTGIFLVGVALLVRKYRRGRTAAVGTDWSLRRLGRAVWIVLSHAWIKRRDGVVGLAHAAIFYGFLVLFIGTAILAFNDDFTRPAFGFDFWRGGFYKGYSLFLDVFGAALLVGLVVMGAKRLRKPFRLDYRRPDRKEGEYDQTPYVCCSSGRRASCSRRSGLPS